MVSKKRLVGSGSATLAGGILFAVITLFHPPLTNPRAGAVGLVKIAESSTWILEHSLLVVALTLWLVGLAGGEAWFRQQRAVALNAARLFIAALAMWLLVLAVELAVLPPIAQAVVIDTDSALQIVGEAIFAFGLMAGYFAMALVWLGVAFLGWSMLQEKGDNWFSLWGVIGGLAGMTGIAFALLFPDFALVTLVLTSLPPYLWTLFFAFKLVHP